MSNSFNNEIEDLEIDTIANLAENIVYRVPGCSDLMVRKSLQSAFSDFARVTCCFTDEYVIELEADEAYYKISATLQNMYVDAVSGVWMDRRKLACPQQYRVMAIGGKPTVILSDSEVSEVGGEKMRVRIVQLPKFGSESAPRWFMNKYGEAVVSGALYRLFSMSGRPWSDTAQAQSELVRYENFTSSARVDSVGENASPFGNCHVDAVDTSGLL